MSSGSLHDRRKIILRNNFFSTQRCWSHRFRFQLTNMKVNDWWQGKSYNLQMTHFSRRQTLFSNVSNCKGFEAQPNLNSIRISTLHFKILKNQTCSHIQCYRNRDSWTPAAIQREIHSETERNWSV